MVLIFALGVGIACFLLAKLPQMGTDAIYALVDEFSSLTNHEGTINIFGGEILLRKDLIEIIQKLEVKLKDRNNNKLPSSKVNN